MRSETETGGEVNGVGTIESGDQSSVSVDEEPLKWRRPSPDGLLIKELMKLVRLAGNIVKKDAQKTIRELKKMEKMRNG